MNKDKTLDTHFKIHLIVTCILTIYFSINLFDAISLQKNMYDFLQNATNILNVSYVIIPALLIVLVSHLSTKNLNNLFLLRYRNKYSFYKKNIKSIFLIVTKFVCEIIGIITLISIFLLDSQNEWSLFAKNYFKNFPLFLEDFSPLLYVVHSFILLWLFLLFLSLFYFIILLITKNTAVSLIVTILVIVTNMAVTISHLELLGQFSFTKHLDFVQYVYEHQTGSSLSSFPFELYIYWSILLLILYISGYKLIHKLDLDLKKGA